MDIVNASEEDVITLIVLDERGGVLAAAAGDGGAVLPTVSVPRFERLGYSIDRAVRAKYKLSLFVFHNAIIEAGKGKETVCVARLQSMSGVDESGLEWLDTQALAKDQQRIIDKSIESKDRYLASAGKNSFGYYSSLDKIRDWVSRSLASMGAAARDIEQWNGEENFQLLRIGLQAGGTHANQSVPNSIWMKAVGYPNTREYAVSLALAKELPQFFPTVLSTKPEWHAWLMSELPGHELADETETRPWAMSARVLGRIQEHFVSREDFLLDLGCEDWRVPRVLSVLDEFFDVVEGIMRMQPSQPPRMLTAAEMRSVKQECVDLCHRIEDLDIPDTLTHGDFSPHNIIVSDGQPRMIDWAEAYVCLPFISWEYLKNRTPIDLLNKENLAERMYSNYAYRIWEPMLGRRRVDEGMRLARSFAVLIHALYGFGSPEFGQSLGSQKSRRSLMRRLQRELLALNEQDEMAGVA